MRPGTRVNSPTLFVTKIAPAALAWAGALARDLKEGTYRPHAVRQVLIPKKQRGKFRPLGIPCLRDRVVQTAAMLVLSPIFEADLQPEQYAYRPGRDAHDAVRRVHRLLTTGHREVVDADLSDYFGQIPHADLMKSIARRVSDGWLLGWVKAWLEMAVEEDDGRGGRRLPNRARHERKGTPQGSPISPLFSNIYITCGASFWAGRCWATARHFKAEIVNYADDFAVLGRAPAAVMLAAVEALMKRLKLAMNVEKTRCCRVPEESMTFLGYRIGCNYRPGTGAALHRHTFEPGKHPEHLPSCERVDRAAPRAPAVGSRNGTPQPVADRLGELLHPGTGPPGLQGD